MTSAAPSGWRQRDRPEADRRGTDERVRLLERIVWLLVQTTATTGALVAELPRIPPMVDYAEYLEVTA